MRGRCLSLLMTMNWSMPPTRTVQMTVRVDRARKFTEMRNGFRDYGDMSEDSTWPRDTADPGDGHHMEGEDMIDRVVISQEGDMIEWYCH